MVQDSKLKAHFFIIMKCSWLFVKIDIKSSEVFRSFKSKTQNKECLMFIMRNHNLPHISFSMFKEIKTYVFL